MDKNKFPNKVNVPNINSKVKMGDNFYGEGASSSSNSNSDYDSSSSNTNNGSRMPDLAMEACN